MNTAAIALEYQAVYARKDSDRSSYGLLIMAILTLLTALVFQIWIKVECTKYGYRLADEMQRTVQLDTLKRDLELQKSILLRPDTLVKKAHNELGLLPLNPTQARKIN